MKKNKIVFGFNAKNGAVFGFYTYLLLSAIDYFYYLFTGDVLFLPGLIYWSGLLVFFIVELIANILKTNRKGLDN